MTDRTRSKFLDKLENIPFIFVMAFAILFTFWPIMVNALEGADGDIGPFFSGQGITFVGGVPFYSGGFHPTLIHYIDAINLQAFPRLIGNTTVIAVSSVIIALVAGVPSGYALARLKLKGQEGISFALLALRTVSPFAIVIPLYILYSNTGLWDTFPGLALAYLVIVIPTAVWMVRGLFSDIPREIYDAAEVSGANESQIFRKIALPYVLLGVMATAIFCIVLIWNEFVIANMLTGPVTKTVSVGIWNGLGDEIGIRAIDEDLVSSASFLAWVPVMILFLVIKRYLAKGFSLAVAS